MSYKLKITILALLFSSNVLAMTPGSYFQQGLTVANHSGHPILITDPVLTELQNSSLENNYKVVMAYASDQFTDPNGQTFSHTIVIHSSVDYSTICTVQSNLVITQNSVSMGKATNSDEAKCQTSVYQQSSSSSLIYGLKITVN
ncbi:MAG: hypothetical protein P4M14_10600 [Gammaproteobacteria bacterium]|nr:hypothetical protein [Gammaproteobacteria bacterium]